MRGEESGRPWNEPLVPDLRVDERDPIDTGLIWKDGSKVMRTPNPIGFGRDKEW